MLKDAIRFTFKNRNTNFIKNHELFSEGFENGIYQNKMWGIFLRKLSETNHIPLKTVLKVIKQDLYPLYLELNDKKQ